MSSPTWQINPALSIRKTLQNRIRVGLLNPNAFEIKNNNDYLSKVIISLRNASSFSSETAIKLIKKYTSNAENTFDDLKHLKIIKPYKNRKSRYSRHELYYNFVKAPENSQKILSIKHVLLIGAGGMGSTCALLLNAAGIGRLTLADSDVLERSNLTRTVLFEEKDVGRKKILAAKSRLRNRNKQTVVSGFSENLTKKNYKKYRSLFEKSDFVILSGDSGLEVHELCYLLSKETNTPFMNAGYVEHIGVAGPITLGRSLLREKEIKKSYDETNKSTELNKNYQAPSYGPLNTMIASIASNECIRYLLGLKTKTFNKRLLVDSCEYSFKRDSFL
jgi:molybdopterin/thiamine biosynthesis adenylyltransferase